MDDKGFVIGDRSVDVDDDLNLFGDLTDGMEFNDNGELVSYNEENEMESGIDLTSDIEQDMDSDDSLFSFEDFNDFDSELLSSDSNDTLLGFDDFDGVYSGYGDDVDLETETEKFVEALRKTLKLRISPTDVESDEVYNTKFHVKGVSKSKMESQVNIMKSVLDLVQKYNRDDKHDINLLPGDLADSVVKNQIIIYDNKDDTVWNVVVKAMISKLKGDVKKLNKLNDSMVELRRTFGLLCETYSDDDKRYFDTKFSTPVQDGINRRRFAFYHRCIERLENDETVQLCKRIIFDRNDTIKYKFVCGGCGKEVFGSTSIQLKDGTLRGEGDNHNFYQVLTKKGYSLHYPLVCEECGSINCLSSSIRESIDRGIKAPITNSSHDKAEYINTDTNTRRSVPYSKWLDMLQSDIEDGDFIVDSDVIFNDENELIVDVADSDYILAIKSFRELNKIYNKKKSFDNGEINKIDYVLAAISECGESSMLRDIVDSVASYIVDTRTFNVLKDCKEEKERLYSNYLQYCAIRSGYRSGDISEEVVNNIQIRDKVKIRKDNINKLCEDSLKLYNDEREYYNSILSSMCTNYRIFSFIKLDKKKNALQELCDVLGNDENCSEFIYNCMCDALFNKAFENISSSFRMKVSGKRVSSKVNVKSSRIKDKEHRRLDRYTLIKSYLSELIRSDGGYDPNSGDNYITIYKYISKLMSDFDIDFFRYQKYCEWRDMFTLSDSDDVNSLSGLRNSDTIYKEYNNHIAVEYRKNLGISISEYSGKKLDDIKPKFYEREYFSKLYNITGELEDCVMIDAKRQFNLILNIKDFRAYDIIFSKLMSEYIGIEKFTGFSTINVASNLSRTDGLIISLYDNCKSKMSKFISDKRKFYNSMLRLSNHSFVSNGNYPGNVTAFHKYVVDMDEFGDVGVDLLEDLFNCIDRAKMEFSSASNVEDELFLQEVI